jgi:2-C-methyl-D-erythritol 4-phosphate cytidylyltransferase
MSSGISITETPVYAIIPAAGTGSRMHLPHNKQFLMLGKYPVIIRTLRVLEAHPRIKGYLVVAASDDLPAMRQLIESSRLTRCLGVAAGGSTRQDSVAHGLRALAGCCGICRKACCWSMTAPAAF